YKKDDRGMGQAGDNTSAASRSGLDPQPPLFSGLTQGMYM
ncbi:unnamed protein product, partial [marine sediment metagenome]